MRSFLVVSLLAVALAACQAPPEAAIVVRGVALAGPSCPVVTDPPDPTCEDRPVAGAEIVVRNEAGESVATVRTDDDGAFAVELLPGPYELVPQPVEGLMGTAPSVEIVVAEDGEPPAVTIAYDTGIR